MLENVRTCRFELIADQLNKNVLLPGRLCLHNVAYHIQHFDADYIPGKAKHAPFGIVGACHCSCSIVKTGLLCSEATLSPDNLTPVVSLLQISCRPVKDADNDLVWRDKTCTACIARVNVS